MKVLQLRTFFFIKMWIVIEDIKYFNIIQIVFNGYQIRYDSKQWIIENFVFEKALKYGFSTDWEMRGIMLNIKYILNGVCWI